MRKRSALFFIVFRFTVFASIAFAQTPYNGDSVICGILRFSDYRFLLDGRRVAFVGNHSSLAGERHSVDFLLDEGADVVKIFAPEHGFRGKVDAGAVFGDEIDGDTGIPVISLYGKKKKPSPEDLKDVDVVLFDIQDVGVRFFTYVSTLHYVMEACAETATPLIVTDRPNPNAFYVDGPVLKPDFRSFIGMHPVPVVYGMTIGEYACMINGEGWLAGGIRCELTVVPCRGWKRNRILSLPLPPSPNLRDSVAVLLYPSLCFFEGTVVSEGRGTLMPFRIYGHPAFKSLPFRFHPESIKGMSIKPKFLGHTCYGEDLTPFYDSMRSAPCINLEWLIKAYRLYVSSMPAGKSRTSFFLPVFDKIAGSDEIRKRILEGEDARTIRSSWQPSLKEFEKIRSSYLFPSYD